MLRLVARVLGMVRLVLLVMGWIPMFRVGAGGWFLVWSIAGAGGAFAAKVGRDAGVVSSARGARMPWVGSWVMSSTVWAFCGDSAREDRVRRVVGGGFFGVFGEDGVGDLQAVEEQAGAAGVDVVGGDALEDFADGLEDGGAVVGIGQREVEGGAAAAALLRVGDGSSGGVVVVAEVFVAEAGAGAAVAVGEDVAALVVLGWFGLGCGVDGVVHVFPPPLGRMCAKSSKEKTCVRTSSECRPMSCELLVMSC